MHIRLGTFQWGIHDSLSCSRRSNCAHLPAGIGIKSSNIHSKRSASRTRKSAIRAAREIVMTRIVTTAASELNRQRLTFEFPAMIG